MNPYKKVAFHTLGCKLNFSETSAIAREFEEAGFARVDFYDRPDVFVFNTCSVTNNADKECRRLVRRALKVNPGAYIAVVGCYAQLKPDEIVSIPGVDLVLGAGEKFNILKHLGDLTKEEAGKAINTDIKAVKDFIPAFSSGDRTRTFLKVQDGCDYFCSFCTIPLARGFSRSGTIQDTLPVVLAAASQGGKEIVLTGVNLGDFGRYNGESFFGLMKELDLLEEVNRYRISSIEPNLLTFEMVDFVAASNRFMPHFHIPLQSGSDEILQAMRRRYLTADYKGLIEKIKTAMPHCCIGVDVIVGYPGETEAHFNETFEFLRDLPVSYLHVFTYSERDNTVAVRKKEELVPQEVRAERSKKLHILSEKKKRAFYEQNKGMEALVLFEAEEEEGFMYGFTENYIKVKMPYKAEYINNPVRVTLTEIAPDCTMYAEYNSTQENTHDYRYSEITS